VFGRFAHRCSPLEWQCRNSFGLDNLRAAVPFNGIIHSTMQDVEEKLKPATLAGGAGYACTRVMTFPKFAPALLIAVLTWEFGVLILEAGRERF
jgi:hypothetical protein